MPQRSDPESLTPEEIAEMLRRADSHSAELEVGEADSRLAAARLPGGLPPPVLELGELRDSLAALAAMGAPFYLAGGGPGGLAKRLANIPIRLLSSKQRAFNVRLVALLDLYLRTLDVFQASTAYQARLTALVERQAAEIEALRAEVAALRRPPDAPAR